MSCLWQYLCCCFGGQTDRHKVSLSTMKLSERYRERSSTDRSASVDPMVFQASSPSHVMTNKLTDVYDWPDQRFKTIDEIIEKRGFKKTKERLGKGMSGGVYKAYEIKTGMTVAFKEMLLKGPKVLELKIEAKNELFIMEKISLKNIIQVFDHFMVKYSKDNSIGVYIIMRLAENKSLSHYIRTLSTGMDESSARRMFAQTVSAVDYMHDKGFAHRDLKMGNILLDQNRDVLVSDFGMSQVMYRETKGGVIMSKKFLGTIPYMAPEILAIKAINKDLSYNPFPADIWALGIILYVMINRLYPFGDDRTPVKDIMENQRKFSSSGRPVCRYYKASQELVDLIHKLFTIKAEDRINIKGLCDHPWIRHEISLIKIPDKNTAIR